MSSHAAAEPGAACVICQEVLKPTTGTLLGGASASAIILTSVSSLDCCRHEYHYECITTWAQESSKCPLCNAQFKVITRLMDGVTARLTSSGSRSRGRAGNRTLVVGNMMDDVNDVSEESSDESSEEEEEEEEEVENPIVCMVCGNGDQGEQLVLCDGRECTHGAHTFCVGLSSIPEGMWRCTTCVQEGRDTNAQTGSTTAAGTVRARRVRRAEERRSALPRTRPAPRRRRTVRHFIPVVPAVNSPFAGSPFEAVLTASARAGDRPIFPFQQAQARTHARTHTDGSSEEDNTNTSAEGRSQQESVWAERERALQIVREKIARKRAAEAAKDKNNAHVCRHDGNVSAPTYHTNTNINTSTGKESHKRSSPGPGGGMAPKRARVRDMGGTSSQSRNTVPADSAHRNSIHTSTHTNTSTSIRARIKPSTSDHVSMSPSGKSSPSMQHRPTRTDTHTVPGREHSIHNGGHTPIRSRIRSSTEGASMNPSYTTKPTDTHRDTYTNKHTSTDRGHSMQNSSANPSHTSSSTHIHRPMAHTIASSISTNIGGKAIPTSLALAAALRLRQMTASQHK